MWSAGFQRRCLSMSFATGTTFHESIGDRSAKCASFPHLTTTQLQFGCRGLRSSTGLLCSKLRLPYSASVKLNPIIDFFKCHFILQGGCGILKGRNITKACFLVFFSLAHGTFSCCVKNMHELICPDVVLLFSSFLLLLPLCSPQDTPQSYRGLRHSSLLREHQSGQAITPPHQGPHSQEQELGQH